MSLSSFFIIPLIIPRWLLPIELGINLCGGPRISFRMMAGGGDLDFERLLLRLFDLYRRRFFFFLNEFISMVIGLGDLERVRIPCIISSSFCFLD